VKADTAQTRKRNAVALLCLDGIGERDAGHLVTHPFEFWFACGLLKATLPTHRGRCRARPELLANHGEKLVYRATQFRACSAPSTMRGSVALRRPQANQNSKGCVTRCPASRSPIPSRHKRQPHYASGFGQCPLSQAGNIRGKDQVWTIQIKRASGWYLCLFIDAEPNPIKRFGVWGDRH